jgi:hypothetical protein
MFNEIKINNPTSLRIIKFGDDDWGLLANSKYLFADTYHSPNRPELDKYEIIYAQVDIEGNMDDPNEYLEVHIPEPSFGGGGDPEEIDEAYDEWENNLDIAEQVLLSHSFYSIIYEGVYKIKLNRISGTNLIPTLDEIKINKPRDTRYYLTPRFKEWLNQDYDDIRYEFDEDTADALYMFKWASPDNKIIRNQDVETLLKSDPEVWSDSTLDSFINFLLDYDIIQTKPPLDEIKTNKPGFIFTNYKTAVGIFNTETDIFKKNYKIELVDLGKYYSLNLYGGPEPIVLIPKQYIEIVNDDGFRYKKELNKKEMDQLKNLINQDKTTMIQSIEKPEEDEPGYNPLPLSYGSEYGRMRETKSFKESFLESIEKTIKTAIKNKTINPNNHPLIKEYSEKTITTTIERWKAADPKTDENIAKQLIQRFDQIKSGLSQKLDIVVLPDELKKGNNYLNIDKYSYNDMVNLIRSLPEKEEKIKKDAVKRFIEKFQIDRNTAQSYVARFIDNRKKLKFGTKEGLEDEGFTKEEVLNYIPKRLQQQDAFFDPRNWDWASFEQMLDAIFPSQKQAGEEGENLASTDADKIYDKNGIEIYKGDDVRKCIEYNPKSDTTGRKKYGWCVTQTNNTNYDFYRFGGGKLQSPTFYFVFDRSKSSSPEHAPFDDQWHAFVIQVEFDQSKYVVTGADNRGDILTDESKGWEGVANIVPADTWNKIKGLKDYFKPINLSAVERGRKFASGKNLSVDEFKELSEDEKILYIQGKASKNQIPPDTLKILPQYKINLEGRSTTLANIAMDAGQKFPYSALKDNEALAKRYAVVSSRYYPNDPLPLPFIKYLDEDAKEKYLVKYDENLTFEYLEKFFGDKIAEEYANKQAKKLDFLPSAAIKYIKDPKLKQLYNTYLKLFSAWKFSEATNISDEELGNLQTMPEQSVSPIPVDQKQWSDFTDSERKLIVDLAEKFNKNTDYITLIYALPYIVKDGDKKYALVPKDNSTDYYDTWVLMDMQGKVVKDNISGNIELIPNRSLDSIIPDDDTDYNRIYDIKNLTK